MKNSKLFLKIYISLLIVTIILLVIFSILGNITRIGYYNIEFRDYHINRTLELHNLSHMKYQFMKEGELDEEAIKNYIFTNENITNYIYGLKVEYYNKVLFRHSDIYGVYVDTNKVLKDNDFIQKIDMQKNGSPFGNLISIKK